MSGRRNLEEEARNFFSKPGFARPLERIWKRYASLEKTGGHAIVPEASQEECEAVNSFMGCYERPGTTLRISLVQFEKELKASVFTCNSIPELHELLVGKPLVTKSEKGLLAERGWRQFFERVERQGRGESGVLASAVQFWLKELRRGTKTAGYRILRDLWSQTAELAEQELTCAARAWIKLEEAQQLNQPAIRLPVLAAIVSGNPHALDRTEPAGRLLIQGLRFDQQRKNAANTEESLILTTDEINGARDSLSVRETYRIAGILDDDVSSLVHLFSQNSKHGNLPFVLTLRQVEAAKELPHASDIYIVENPAVFSTLVDRTVVASNQNQAEALPLLICTSGPASAAALRLLDFYAQDKNWNGSFYYSGDYDIKGIGIANILAYRYREYFVPWRFDTDNYRLSTVGTIGVPFTDDEQGRLTISQALWDPTLTAELKDQGRKLYQEQFINLLVEDWITEGCS